MAADHLVGFFDEPLAFGDAGPKLMLVLFEFARLTVAPGIAGLLGYGKFLCRPFCETDGRRF